MRTRCLVAALTLFACKAESDQATRPLPAPEPPATTRAELTPVTASPERPRERAPREAREQSERPTTPAAEPAPTSTPAATATATPTTTASAAPAAPDASCQQACQTGLQTCLAQQPPEPDGGTGLEGLAACKKALDDCKARCGP